jgi:hypothetical protein
MEPVTLALLSIAGGLTAVAGATASSGPWHTPEPPNRGRRDPIPVPPPKPIRPAPGRYGQARRLIETQRAWMATETPQASTAAPTEQARTAAAAFTDWFEQNIVVHVNDVLSFDDWAKSYVEHCNAHGYPKLNDHEVFALIGSYANSLHCTIGEHGEFIGGHLKG